MTAAGIPRLKILLGNLFSRPNTVLYLGTNLPAKPLREIQSAQLVFHPQSAEIFAERYAGFIPAQQ